LAATKWPVTSTRREIAGALAAADANVHAAGCRPRGLSQDLERCARRDLDRAGRVGAAAIELPPIWVAVLAADRGGLDAQRATGTRCRAL